MNNSLSPLSLTADPIKEHKEVFNGRDDDDPPGPGFSAPGHGGAPLGQPPFRNRNPPRHVDHTYRDYSRLSVGELQTRKKQKTNFPSKLHQILSSHEFTHVSPMT